MPGGNRPARRRRSPVICPLAGQLSRRTRRCPVLVRSPPVDLVHVFEGHTVDRLGAGTGSACETRAQPLSGRAECEAATLSRWPGEPSSPVPVVVDPVSYTHLT